MTCFTKSRIPTEEVKLEITLDGRPEKYEVTWGELWSSQPGYPLQLNESEIWWRDRYDMLARRGYRLLPRYSPDWKPSWSKPCDSYPEFTALKATFRPDKYEDTVAVRPSPYHSEPQLTSVLGTGPWRPHSCYVRHTSPRRSPGRHQAGLVYGLRFRRGTQDHGFGIIRESTR